MGVELAGAIIGLTLVGLWIDHRYDTGPKGIIVGAAIGIVGGGYNFIRQALEMMRADERQRKQRGESDNGDNTSDR